MTMTTQHELHCRCGHMWCEGFTFPMTVDAFVKRMRGMTCPNCGRGYRAIKWKANAKPEGNTDGETTKHNRL